jgi:hypothetical protein
MINGVIRNEEKKNLHKPRRTLFRVGLRRGQKHLGAQWPCPCPDWVGCVCVCVCGGRWVLYLQTTSISPARSQLSVMQNAQLMMQVN